MIDLSHTIASGMTVFPGDPEVMVEPALTLDEHGVAVSALHLGTHSGTHLDAPAHSVVGGRTLDQVTLDELVGEALVIRFAELEEFEEIDVATLERAGVPSEQALPPIVLLQTGWCRFFGRAEYLRHPFLTVEAAIWLRDRGMHVLGVDTLNPDRTPLVPHESARFPVHEVVLGGDGLIVENLRGLARVGERARVGFFPLSLGPVDGAPVRAVAEL